MKIAIVGGAGVRTPLLVRGLTTSDLPIDTIALFDTHHERLELIAPLASKLASGVGVTMCRTPGEAFEDADFVFTSIRVGGASARASDEAAAMAHGIVGQETVGPGGFAMGMRSIPPMVEYAREVQRRAPHAWIINFTNPVGIVTEAVQKATGAKIIGICDTPTELFEQIAGALGVHSSECDFDYLGLNHLGWVREVFYRGEPQLARLWNDLDALGRLYRVPLFDPAFLSQLHLLPTEYLFYYYRSGDALSHLRQAGRTRGTVVEELNRRLFESLARPESDGVREYDRYVAARNDGYMQLETGADGSSAALSPATRTEPTGYDRIALAVVRAIHFDAGHVIPLNVMNRGALLELEHDDVVEVPCAVRANGAHPVRSTSVPSQVRDLLFEVKEYERLTVRAALEDNEQLAIQALARNPLVRSETLAAALFGDLRR